MTTNIQKVQSSPTKWKKFDCHKMIFEIMLQSSFFQSTMRASQSTKAAKIRFVFGSFTTSSLPSLHSFSFSSIHTIIWRWLDIVRLSPSYPPFNAFSRFTPPLPSDFSTQLTRLFSDVQFKRKWKHFCILWILLTEKEGRRIGENVSLCHRVSCKITH